MRMEMFLLVFFIGLAAVQDIRKKQVKMWIYFIFSITAVCLAVYRLNQERDWWIRAADYGAGMLPGVILLWGGRVSGGEIGNGDGFLFLISGLFLGFWKNMVLLCYGTFFCGIFCLIYFVWGKLKSKKDVRKQTVPFIPFLAVPALWMAADEFAGMWKG